MRREDQKLNLATVRKHKIKYDVLVGREHACHDPYLSDKLVINSRGVVMVRVYLYI